MPLKAIVASLDEVPEPLREFYTARDGKFVLDAEGVEDVSGLKRSLERERAEKKALQDTVAKYKNLDPEKARVALEKLEALEDKELIDAGKVEELLQVRVERMRSDYDQRLAAVTTENQTLSQKLSELVIDSAIQSAAIKHKVRETAVSDALLRGRSVFRLVDGKAVPQKADGTVLYGKDGQTPLSPEEWVGTILVKDAPHLFVESTGGGTPPGGTPRSGMHNGRHVISQEDAKDFTRYAAAKAEASKAGVELVIQ